MAMRTAAAAACLLSPPAGHAFAAVISGINPSVTFDVSDFGLSALQGHGTFSGTSNMNGGELPGSPMATGLFRTSITKQNIALWTYRNKDGKLNPSASYSITNPTAKNASTASSTVTIVSVVAASPAVGYDSASDLYTGYANITFDFTNARNSGAYTTTGSTLTITVTNL